MSYRKALAIMSVPLSLMAWSGYTATAQAANPDELVASKGTTPPKLDGAADDPIWAQAKPLTVKLEDGTNLADGETTATLKAAYVGDTLYVLLQYDDPTQSVRRSPYVKQEDGSWKKLKDPDDKGGDNNKYYEDKIAMIWPIDNSIERFPEKGCQVLCHEDEGGKPFGVKYTPEEGDLADMWHLKTVRTGYIGQADDQYVDNTRYDKEKAPEAGRKSDPKTGGGYTDNELVDGKPKFMSKDAKPANGGGTYYIREADKVAFDDSKFKPGDEVASIIVAPLVGDRGDIAAGIAWNDGKWTMEMARKLVTGNKTDVQFDDLSAPYLFGVSVFDNAQVRHAYHGGALKLVFTQ